MLRLSRGRVVASEPLTVEVEGERRRAWADPGLVGPCEVGDEVVVNVAALDLGLGSGGYDVVHVNLSRGLDAEREGDAHVMKLNYTSLQHPVEPVEAEVASKRSGRRIPVLAIGLHGQLAPAVWQALQVRPGARVGYVQTHGGALAGSLSSDVAKLRGRELVCGHVAAAQAFGAEHEAISIVGAIDACAERLGWDGAVVGPGPGILGSESDYGHGGMAALDAAHAGLALGMPTLVAPRLSSGDPRPRHRGLSHHTRAVLSLALATVRVPVPEIDLAGWPALEGGDHHPAEAGAAVDELIALCENRHDLAVVPVDLEGYSHSGLPARTMGRDISQDPLFFAAALAGGAALAALL